MLSAFYPLLILLAPLTAGLIVGLRGRALGQTASRIGAAADALAFTLALLLLFETANDGPRTLQLSPWSDGILQFDLYLDRLSAVMLVHIAAISMLIHLFSVRYMQQENGHARFQSLLAFTTFTLFGMVSSGNLLLLLIFWNLLSWLLPLLSHNYEHPPTVRGAFRTFITQRAGDAAFLAAVVLVYGWYGTLDLRQLFARAAEAGTMLSFWPGIDMRATTVATLLIFIGAMAKSAQFPLHLWLPDYLYAPTPVTALLHAGIINAGGFLLARLAPLYGLSPTTLHLVFAVGMLTALLGSSMMLVQSDIKKTLGYSTIGQMGFMIMECGVGAYGLAIFHLIAHGLFKGSLFLNCGYVIHAARKEPRFPAKTRTPESIEFAPLTWLTGFVTTLILPLVIVLAAHGVLDIPLRDSQGTAIFLFFGWATSSQAILTLYRLRAVASWKVAVSMLAVLFVVVVTYLFAAEKFTYFLFPAPGAVAAHFKAGALPVIAFDILIAAFALIIVFGWYLIYAMSHGRTIRTPAWVDTLQVRLYLFLLNRLYLDGLSMRLRGPVERAVEGLNSSKLFSFGIAAAAVIAALSLAVPLPELPAANIGVAALLLPLFPLHGIYVAALTRTPVFLAAVLAVAMPAAGLYRLAEVLPQIPAEVLPAVSALALFGALYGSLKALGEKDVTRLLAHAGVVFFSSLWWHAAVTGAVAGPAVVYTAAAAVVLGALLLASAHLARRYGELTLDRMHGLAVVMPRFGAVVMLLTMAAAGLPPFGLFSAYAAMLLQPGVAASGGLVLIVLCGFLTSWYLFRMMQRLLFGSPRTDIRYADLRPRELVYFTLLVMILGLLGMTPPQWLDSEFFANGRRIAMEITSWQE